MRCLLLLLSPLVLAVPFTDQYLGEFASQRFALTFVTANTPGVVFSVVKDGKPLFGNGFGLENEEAMIMANHEKSLFPVGEISQLLTAIAVLRETGDMSEEAFKSTSIQSLMPGMASKGWALQYPTTLHQLLTHTAGLESQWVGSLTAMPLGDDAAEKLSLPPQFTVPGGMIAPSNFGYFLLQKFVEFKSGVSFERYVQDNILKPLGMRNSTLTAHQEHDTVRLATLRDDPSQDGLTFARGYQLLPNKTIVHVPGVRSRIPAADGLVSTSSDMATLLSSLMNPAEHPAVLSADRVQWLFKRQEASHPSHLTGMAYGWRHHRMRNDADMLCQQATGIPGFGHQLCMIPSRRVGFFLGTNAGNTTFLEETRQEFLRTFLPKLPPILLNVTVPAPLQGAQQRANECAGRYVMVQHARTTVEKLLTLSSVAHVTVADEGRLWLQWEPCPWFGVSLLPKAPLLLVEIEPYVYRQVKQGILTIDDPFVFRPDAEGDDDRLSLTIEQQPATMIRVPWHHSWKLHILMAVLAVLMSAATFVAVGFRLVVNRKQTLLQTVGDSMVFLVSGLVSLFCGMLWLIAHVSEWRVTGLEPHLDTLTSITMIPQVIQVALTALLAMALPSAVSRRRPFSSMAWPLLAVVSSITVCWLARYWNLEQQLIDMVAV